ncbi:hypothetical protein B0O99DRAFT_520430 [Bisporella sp. PMI_857]|nr:hypothetical protein B0O99DRAFT_520430 [Bisporella sp. PMI_857]
MLYQTFSPASINSWPPAPQLKDQCPQAAPLLPNITSPALDAIIPLVDSEEYRKISIGFLSNAVKIPTVTHDGMGIPGEDERYEVFYKFYEYLQETFPLVHSKLSIEKIFTHGLLYTWEGSNSSLKPTLLMAHQDVVPVPEQTIPTWTHPPFDGFYDGKYIWGRGASDCKNQLIGILEAVELLLKADFKPTRTLILSFGFDEESGGVNSAGHLARAVEARYGQDSIAVIVDEGMKAQKLWGATVVQPGVAEKGSININIKIRMPGGHSSVPPPHTSIGVLSELIQLVERDTYQSWLDVKNPYYGTIQCGAAHAPEFPDNLRKILKKEKPRTALDTDVPSCMRKQDALAEEAAKESLFHKYLMTTSIAVDVSYGGEKSNALPEEATAIVNHRVNIGETVQGVRDKVARLAGSVAKNHNLTVHAFDNVTASSSIILTAPFGLDPAPVTPTSLETGAWRILSGTTKAQYGTDVILSPGLMTGNTDTRNYWDLSRDIFRYGPGFDREELENGDVGGTLGRIHTVDERVSVVEHLEGVKWFVGFVRNMDEADV